MAISTNPSTNPVRADASLDRRGRASGPGLVPEAGAAIEVSHLRKTRRAHWRRRRRVVPGMTDAGVPDRAAGVGRLGTAAAWISAACCVPYLVLKVVWTAGLPVGITDRSVLHGHGWAAANALMAAVELAGLLLVLALTRPWARRWPAWLLLVPVWVGTGLLFRVVVGAALAGLSSASSHASGGTTGGIQPWVFVMVYASFAGQGAALAIAFACYVRARWGPLLGARTGQVVARRTARARSWPEDHLAEMAVAVAGLAVVVAAVFCYWAAGGSFGLSGAQPHPSWALEVSGVAGAVIAVAGLLGLAGRWGHQTRFWLPAALAWVGSGSLAAFDGLELFLTFGTGLSGSGWSLTDTVLVIEVVTGVLCAAVGAVAVTSAARDDHKPAGTQRTGRRCRPARATTPTEPVRVPGTTNP
jgi:hypothetical protein